MIVLFIKLHTDFEYKLGSAEKLRSGVLRLSKYVFIPKTTIN